MSLKFADKYYNKYKMHLLEQAAHDVIGVVSLGCRSYPSRGSGQGAGPVAGTGRPHRRSEGLVHAHHRQPQTGWQQPLR